MWIWIAALFAYAIGLATYRSTRAAGESPLGRWSYFGAYAAVTGMIGTAFTVPMCCSFPNPSLQALRLVSVVALAGGLGLFGADVPRAISRVVTTMANVWALSLLKDDTEAIGNSFVLPTADEQSHF